VTDASIDEFGAPGNKLWHWQKKADSLLTAARILRTHAGRSREVRWGTLWPELMLWGCAVEALLKALRLKNAIESRDAEQLLFRNGRLERQVRTHDLVCLAHAASFRLDHSQRKILEQLTRAVKHGGRYPLPTKDEAESCYWYGPDGDDELDAIVSALKERLPRDPVSYQREKLDAQH